MKRAIVGSQSAIKKRETLRPFPIAAILPEALPGTLPGVARTQAAMLIPLASVQTFGKQVLDRVAVLDTRAHNPKRFLALVEEQAMSGGLEHVAFDCPK